ncbi:uncharacterized protein LOC129570773 [Sitodiplosis mosellana]|uniref:uncharacterized protein LOC129570773 n=1 Tax=Sitodiplosis mosellana TaxID=263140 RepID=UPI0024438B4B|nr:uncharacterized protein LOC129570773 [Sitodiplosis mosellana]XP_055306466.1 uncharacterized protein LOC129570773 [Sitodiplosis mosellana]
METMKLTDLNFDCLENILEYLELVDLLNAADSCKRLNKAAELVFDRKHGKKTVSFGEMQISTLRLVKYKFGDIHVNDLKTGLQLLRCLGRVIHKICFEQLIFEESIQLEIDRKLATYVNAYCAEYLKEGDFQRNGVLEYFDKPFPKLRGIHVLECKFTEINRIKRLFPNLESLMCSHYEDVSFYNTNATHFPRLKSLTFFELGYDPISDVRHEQNLRNEMVSEFLKLNPQLKELHVSSFALADSYLTIDLIRSEVDNLQNIESLYLDLKPITVHDDIDNIIHMKRVKTFITSLRHYNNEWPTCSLPFSFEKLEKFDVSPPKQIEFLPNFFEDFFNFIDKFPKITDLSISSYENSSAMDWSRLTRSLPLLVTISIHISFSTDEAIDFMAKFPLLRKFNFMLSDLDELEYLCQRLGKKWRGRELWKRRRFVQLKRIV